MERWKCSGRLCSPEIDRDAAAAWHRSPGQPRSKSWDECAAQSFDLVITVCDQAAGESCPRFPGNPRKLHWSTPDPAKVTGSEAEMDAAFDTAFFLLKNRVEEFIKRLPAHAS
jgi:arsenate reductase (thioredoxin)